MTNITQCTGTVRTIHYHEYDVCVPYVYAHGRARPAKNGLQVAGSCIQATGDCGAPQSHQVPQDSRFAISRPSMGPSLLCNVHLALPPVGGTPGTSLASNISSEHNPA